MKFIITASLVILMLNASIAQTKLGLKLSPSIITQRITQSNDSISVTNGSKAFNPSLTLFAEISFSENYFFTTGIGYISKRVNLKVTTPGFNTTQNKSYNTQYIQVPATLKLYTNEIALDKKLYFQFGPLIDIAIHTKESDGNFNVIKKMQPIDISLLFASGLQIQLAPQTSIQIGINYTRGLINIISKDAINDDGFIIKNDLYGIDIAVKF